MSLLTRPFCRSLSLSTRPSAPTRKPVNGLMHKVQLLALAKAAFFVPLEFVGVGIDRTFRTSLLLFSRKLVWLKTLKNSALSSSRIVSLRGIRNALMTERSKR